MSHHLSHAGDGSLLHLLVNVLSLVNINIIKIIISIRSYLKPDKAALVYLVDVKSKVKCGW
jgi:hypothetical protein